MHVPLGIDAVPGAFRVVYAVIFGPKIEEAVLIDLRRRYRYRAVAYYAAAGVVGNVTNAIAFGFVGAVARADVFVGLLEGVIAVGFANVLEFGLCFATQIIVPRIRIPEIKVEANKYTLVWEIRIIVVYASI